MAYRNYHATAQCVYTVNVLHQSIF